MVGHKLIMGTPESKKKWENPAKKVDYDFAPKLDIDMRRTEGSIDQIETREGHKFEPWNFVQTDSSSDPICNSAGCTQYKHPKKDRGYDLDYPVVNLGQDRDISDHFTNLNVAEKIVGHKWDFKLEKPPLNPAKKTRYDFSPKLDGDMISAAHSLDLAEDITGKKYAAWMGVQTDADINEGSDPVCSSSGCWHSDYFKHQEDKIIQYPDPVADGYDKDVATTLKHEKEASASTGLTWDPWEGAKNRPAPKGPSRVRSVAEIMDWVEQKTGGHD